MTAITKPEGKLISIGENEIFAIDIGEGGTPVIFLHGGGPGGDSWIDFSPVLEYFTDRRTIFLDLLQYGGSSKVPFPEDELSWSYHAKHVVAAMDALGVDKADFVCSSIGGSAALATAAMYPERVRRVVLSGSQPTIDVPGALEGQMGLGMKWVAPYYADEGPTREKAVKLISALEWYDPNKIPDHRIEDRLAGSMKLRELQAHPNPRGIREDLTEKLKTIEQPVLFYWGKEDPFLPPEYGLYLSRLVKHGDMHVMHKASHHLFAERPHDYSLVVKGFLDADQMDD